MCQRNHKNWRKRLYGILFRNKDDFFGQIFEGKNLKNDEDIQLNKLSTECKKKSLQIMKLTRLGLREAAPLLGKKFTRF